MDADTERMSAELRDEIASNERRIIDPRTVPARFHNLKAMAISAAHGLASFQYDGDETLAKRIGSGVHAMLFNKPCVKWTGKVRRGEKWDAFVKENPGKLILTSKAWDHSAAIVASIKRHPIAMQLLFGPGTIHEKSIAWEMHGRKRRSTPDVRGDFHVVELKTTRCAEVAKFTRDAGYRGYHAQLADQCLAIEHETGKRPSEVYIVAVETVRPYVVQVLQVSDYTLGKGERLVVGWMARLLEAERTNQWPGYSEGIEMLDIPDDAFDAMFVDEAGAPSYGDEVE